MKKYLFFTAVYFISMLYWDVSACAREKLAPEELYARSAVLMDADSGRILFEKNGEAVLANASTTKILTCILALEMGNLTDQVTVSQKAAAQPAVRMGMQTGQQFYLKDLLYSLMLESHNDTAVAIAEHIGGSVEQFAELMNEKAKEIGCRNTHFVSPNGLDWEDEDGAHETTAADLALLMRYCISESEKKDEFLEITGTQARTFSDCDGSRTYSCVNHNAFLSMMEGALSGKTGYTNKAGYCYVGALEEEERTFIVALLACGWPNNKSYKWSDTKKMMEYGLTNYQYEDVIREIPLKPVLVEDGIAQGKGLGEEIFVTLGNDSAEEYPLLLSDEDEVKIQVTVPRLLQAPVEAGTEVGEICYFLNGEKFLTYPITAAENIDKKDYRWCLKQTLSVYMRQK